MGQFSVAKEQDVVDLQSSKVTNDTIRYICRTQASKARVVWLGRNDIHPQSLIPFRSVDWKNLVDLFLCWNSIGNDGCKYLSQINFNHLQLLGLGCNQIDSKGLLHLSKNRWKKLRKLYLWNNNIGRDGIRWLNKGNSSKLQHITGNRLTEQQLNLFAISKATSIKLISIKNNKIEKNSIKKIKQIIRRKSDKIFMEF